MLDIEQNNYLVTSKIYFYTLHHFKVPPKILNRSIRAISLRHNLAEKIFANLFFYIPPLRILLHLLKMTLHGQRYDLYSSWMFQEAEFLSSLPINDKHFYIEDGQLSLMPFHLYPNNYTNRWVSRAPKLKSNRMQYSYREDASGFLCITPGAFDWNNSISKFYYDNFESCFQWYTPKLVDIKTIILSPHPKRLSPDSYLSSIMRALQTVPNRWALQLHWGIYSYPKLYREILNKFKAIPTSTGILCDRDTIIELEMIVERKELLGPITSLAHYARMFNSSFQHFDFDGYQPPEKYFMP